MTPTARHLLFAGLAVALLSAEAGTQSPQLRIGVFGLLRPTELHVRPLRGSVLELQAGGERFLLEGAWGAVLRARGEKVEGHTRDRTFSADAVRFHSRSGRDAEFLLSVPGRLERRFQGELEVRADAAVLVPVVRMDLETAVASAVSAESPPGAPPEALKAQAVVTRSYYVAQSNRHRDFHFCDTTHCQYLRHPPPASSPAARAVRETAGLILTFRGKPLAALYTASCGGRTRTLVEIGLQVEDYPYYSVPCDYCRTHAPRWESRLSSSAADALLAAPHSETVRINIGREIGWKAIPGNNYTLEEVGGEAVVKGRGAGHGAGLCQQGAAALAHGGLDYRAILRHYFPNTTIVASSD